MNTIHRVAQWVGWMPEPDVDTRGTWSILQSCSLAIFFCTATSLHLNIPPVRLSSLRIRLNRLKWMIVNTFAPEVFMCVAVTQVLEAHMVRRRIKSYCTTYEKCYPEWTLSQALYYNMGGYVYGSRHPQSCCHQHPKQLKIKHLEYIVEKNLIGYLNRSHETVKRFSKTDWLSKIIALLQALWVVVHTFARFAAHLPTSPLEITAVAYVSCTFFTFVLWWWKPQNVGVPTEVRNDGFEKVIRLACGRRQEHNRSYCNYHDNPDLSRDFHRCHKDDSSKTSKRWHIKSQLPNIRRNYGRQDQVIIGLTWCFSASLFGGLHLLAWDYRFPTDVESIAWRVASLLIIVLPPTFYVRLFFLRDEDVVHASGLFLVTLYILARVYNLFEVFFCFRSTPPDLYRIVHWTELLPHF